MTDRNTERRVYGATRLSDQYRPRANATAIDGSPTRTNIAEAEYRDLDNPTLWDAVGYPSDDELDKFETFWLRYERQGVARGLIDKPARDTWRDTPEVIDTGSEEDSQTDFEEQAERFMAGETLRRQPSHRFNVVDRLATLGQYAVMVLGFADGRDLSTPVQGAEAAAIENDPTATEGEFSDLDDLHYIATFGEDRVTDIEQVTDMNDPRFRLPKSYEIVTEGDDEDDAETVHWSRVVHVPEGTLEDDLRGTPYYKPIFHNLVNLDKISAGSAEGYWRGGYQGLVVRPPKGPDGQQLRFSNEQDSGSDELQNQIHQYEENMRRVIATTGQVESLGSQVADPESHATQQYKEIAAAKDIPQSVLMGNETGERATGEDDSMWKEHIAGRRANFSEPAILFPVFDRLIAVGVLPAPTDEGYEFDWPPQDEMTAKEEAEVTDLRASALKKYTGGAPDRIATRGELRNEMGWDTTLGSEVDGESIEPETEVDDPTADDLRVDENDEEVQDQFDQSPPGQEPPTGDEEEEDDAEEEDAEQPPDEEQ